MASKVAVVSGSNKGIGFAIVRGLCKKFDGDVFLTARDVGRGHAAVAELEKEGLKPKFHQLDITDHNSVEELKKFLEDKYGGLDVLVNNAAIAYKSASTVPFSEQAENSVRVNFTATLDVCRTLFPILKPHARVVHVSSTSSTMALNICSKELLQTLTSCTKLEQVEKNMQQFVRDVKDGSFKSKGWPETAYGISKVGVTTMTPIQQEEFSKDISRPDIVVNCCCPGYVATDMSSYKGHKTIDEGADTPLYLALLPPNVAQPKGELLSERKVVKWH